jgi:hypothetical protein
MIAATGGAAAAAAAAGRGFQEEEEEMTHYSPGDLADGWEFKILRSRSGAFRDPEKLRAALQDEKRGGWVFLEKFDDCGVRLKRPAGTKVAEDDIASGYDPYRTTLGVSNELWTLSFLVTLFGFLLMLLVLGCTVAILTRPDGPPPRPEAVREQRPAKTKGNGQSHQGQKTGNRFPAPITKDRLGPRMDLEKAEGSRAGADGPRPSRAGVQ